MTELKDALLQILTRMKTCPPVKLPLLEALGHVLRDDIFAPEPLPAFSNSSMDGFAVRSDDIKAVPARLRIIEEIPAGTYPRKKLLPGTCSSIMTGAPIPENSDSVVPLEHTKRLNGAISILSLPVPGQFVRSKGEEIREGDLLWRGGTVLKPEDLALMASLGFTRVPVIRKPTISLFTTGSEVIDHSLYPRPGQIRNSNLISLYSSLRNLGYSLSDSFHLKDDPDLLERKLALCKTDVIISCGAVSVGKYDYVKTALSRIGKIYFWRVAIKPGKPFLFGRVGKSWFFGLPGNPVSALVTFELLVKPALARLSGIQEPASDLKKAIVTSEIPHAPGRLEYVGACVKKNSHGLIAHPLQWRGSHMLRSLTEANAWVVVPINNRKVPAGSTVHVMFREPGIIDK